MSLPSIQGFPACCGAAIVNGFFTSDPNTAAGYKLDKSGYGYATDAKGEKIPITFGDKFLADMEMDKKQKRSFMWLAVLNEQQTKQFDGVWLKLLKQAGFVPIRRWFNYNHQEIAPLYLFALVTDYKGKCKGELISAPPKGWDEIPTEAASPLAA